MKQKLLALALCLAIVCAAVPALSEQAQNSTLQGLITEVDSGYFIMEDEQNGAVRVNLDDAITTYEGVAAKDKLAVGQYVFVQYNGTMTRSLPPQVTALTVGCFVVNGTVGDILPNGYIVTGDAVLGDVIVHMDDTLPSVYQGVPITLYYNGIMALSMPPQINAAYIVVPMLEGTVSSAASDGFTLTDAGGTAHRVTLTADTRVLTLPAKGELVRVYYNGQLSESGDATALEVSAIPGKDAGTTYTQE